MEKAQNILEYEWVWFLYRNREKHQKSQKYQHNAKVSDTIVCAWLCLNKFLLCWKQK